MFNLRVPSPGPSRRERLFPERPDFPTGTKCGLFAGHESWLGAARPGLALPGSGPAISLRHIPPSPQLGLTAGSCGEPQDKGGKMGHVYSFTDQPGPGWPMGPSPWQWKALVLLVGSPVTTAPRDHTPNTGRASWRQKLAWSLYLIVGEPGEMRRRSLELELSSRNQRSGHTWQRERKARDSGLHSNGAPTDVLVYGCVYRAHSACSHKFQPHSFPKCTPGVFGTHKPHSHGGDAW